MYVSKRKLKKRKMLSTALILSMAFGSFPTSVYASEIDDTISKENDVEEISIENEDESEQEITVDTVGIDNLDNEFIPGDINGDSKVDTADVVLLRQYLDGKKVEITNEAAMDVNADGNYTIEDLNILRRYIVGGYGVELKKTSVYSITYHLYDGDSYLENIEIENKNPSTYIKGKSIKLSNLSVKGYKFEGWFDGEGSSATQIKTIASDEEGNKDLYAHWSPIEYTVQFDSSLCAVKSKTYTTNKGTTLDDPSLSGYIFVGWTDDNNKLVEEIKKGTVGNITLHANWTSKRNMTRPVSKLGDPIINHDEENGSIQFAYEIGKIENVPLYTIEYLGNKADGITYTKTTTSSGTISDTTAKSIAESVANATTRTSSWSLSSEWNDVTTKGSSHTDGSTSDSTTTEVTGKNTSEEWNIGNGNGGSQENTIKSGVSAKLGISTSAGIPNVAEVKVNTEIGGTVDTTDSNVRTWNSSSGYAKSANESKNTTTSNSLSNMISNTVSYNVSRSVGGSESSSTALATSSSSTKECASSFTYSTQKTETSTIQYSNADAPEGYYRVVCAGTLHVFAVVNYDIASRSYGVYTYSILEDEVKDFLDYSKDTPSFDDYDNGVLPFKVPYFVNQYVDSVVGRAESDGYVVDTDTGMIVNYTGNSKNVVIPKYITADNGDDTTSIIKVTGFEAGAFAGKDIESVELCDNITEIPANAFKNCSSLQKIVAPGIEKIGDNAFAGCNSLKQYTITDKVTLLGANAFDGAENLTVNAGDKKIVEKAVKSGAKNIILNIGSLGEAMNNYTLEIPEGIESCTVNGGGNSYTGFRIISDAVETIVNRVEFTGTKAAELKLSSSKVTLNRVNVISDGWGMILLSDKVELKLNGTIKIDSTGENAILCRTVELKSLSANVVGKLSVNGNILTCKSVQADNLLTFTKGAVVTIDEAQYEKLLSDSWSEWSEWSTTEISPSLDTEVEKKVQYQYSDKKTTTSTNSSLAGWIQTGSTTSYGSYGGWSSWGRDYVGGSDTRQVDTATVYGYYYYRCPNCGAHMHVYTACYTWAGGCGQRVMGPGNAVLFFDPTPNNGMAEFHGTGHYYTDGFPQHGRVFRWTDNGRSSWTGYRYRDRSKTTTYSYYKWDNWSAWSDTAYTSSDTRKVQTRTVYRYRTRQ